MVRENRIKRAVESGSIPLGATLNIYSPHLVELAGAMGFEWVFIDCEHGPMNETEVEHMVRAAEAYDMTPVVRVPVNSPSVILRFLDLGALGIVVPHIDSVADAEAAAAAVRYPPQGIRGSNYGTGRNNAYGEGTEDVRAYYEAANRETMLFALIESADGVEEIEGIARVAGVDATWLGPADLALSMGMPEQARVDEALDRVVTTTIAAGKHSAVTHLPPDQIDRLEHFHELGSRIFATNLLALMKLRGAEWLDAVKRMR